MSHLKFHYAFLIFLGCCSLTAGGFALVYNLAGVYMLPVSQSLGLTAADVSLWLAADGTMALVAMPLAGHLMQKPNMNKYMTMGAIVTTCGVFCFRFCTKPLHFILCGCLTGFGMPYLYGIAEVTLISNWFSVKKQGRFLGIAMACQGIAAAIWAPLYTQIVHAIGWQDTYVVNAAMIAVMTLPWTIFVFRRDPRQKGLQPYGSSGEESLHDAQEVDAYVGVSLGDALKTSGFWIALIASCTACIGMGFESHQQAIAVEFLGSTGIDEFQAMVIGSVMMTFYGIGTVVGDVAFGEMLDRMPMPAVFAIFLTMFFSAFLLWFLFRTSIPVLMIGSFLLGSHNGLASVGYPLLVRRLFGGRQFSKIYALVNTACSFFGGYTALLISLVYSGFGKSYADVMLVADCVVALLALFSFFAIRKIGTYTWEDEMGNIVEPYEQKRIEEQSHV